MVESLDDLNYRESRSKRVRRFYANINFNEGDTRGLVGFGLTYLFSMGIEFWRGFRGETISFLHWDIVDPMCPINQGESTSLFIPRQACGPSVFKFIQTNLVRTRDATEFAAIVSEFLKLAITEDDCHSGLVSQSDIPASSKLFDCYTNSDNFLHRLQFPCFPGYSKRFSSG